MRRLATLLRRLVESTAAAAAPEDKFSFASSRLTDPGPQASLASQIDQYLTDLARYRDDAHLAACRPSDISGHGWEALTMIWREEADTPAALAQKLERRGHDQAAYAEALDGLRGRGWVEEHDGVYRVTERGRALRQAAEDATDELFYAPWSCLDDGETQELRQLLTQLRDQLQRMSEHAST
jgi:DNA-binding MarR family transcriptional regulator